MRTRSLHLSFLMVICLWANIPLSAQSIQNIKGNVTDAQSGTPLIGAYISLLEGDRISSQTVSDEKGNYRMERVPIGRQSFSVSYLGYKPVLLSNIMVTAGKEVVLDIALEEDIKSLSTVEISSKNNPSVPVNAMSNLSGRVFSIEDVSRIPASRNDVARMAGNFAGVLPADVQRNDIVVRGNAPTGLLWRLGGVPIVNPNHFATLGATGGAVSAINPNLLAKSDFLTGAFSAEYGNAIGGAFDLSFRSGNKDRLEGLVQVGASSGMEAMLEGPMLRKNGGSFLASYRYSFVEIMGKLGVNVTGMESQPQYQDLSFKLDLGQSKIGRLEVFGIAGNSSLLFPGTSFESKPESRVGIWGVNHRVLLNKNAYLKTSVAYNGVRSKYTTYDLRGSEPVITEKNQDTEERISLTSFYHQKINARANFRAGLTVENYNSTVFSNSTNLGVTRVYRDYTGQFNLWQPFVQGQYHFSKQFSMNAGLHAMYLSFNQKSAIEPRAALIWKPAEKHQLGISYGLHNQMQPLPVYLEQATNAEGVRYLPNQNLDFLKSQHLVFDYIYVPAPFWLFKFSAFQQNISNAGVQAQFASGYSTLNSGDGFNFSVPGVLNNDGSGYNKGLELTVDKQFSAGYYLSFTGTLMDSKYRGSDDVLRNSTFNSRFILNFSTGTELNLNKQHTLIYSMHLLWAGGRYYTPIDLVQSRKFDRQILSLSQANQAHFRNVFRWDMRLGYRFNSPKSKFTHEFSFDGINITAHGNPIRYVYNRATKDIKAEYQIRFIPDVNWKLTF